MPNIAKVVINLSLNKDFDYLIPEELINIIKIGSQVAVPFGNSERIGFVIALADNSKINNLKTITRVIGSGPLISDNILRLAQWISQYYLAPIEQVLKAILPATVRKVRKREKRKTKIENNELLNSELLRTEPLRLMPEQEKSLELIIQSVNSHEPSVVLLYGVTGSGKTEVYMQAISTVLNKQHGVIVLVPEIALTPQTVERFRSRFGDQVALLHSHLTDSERYDYWHKINTGETRIVIGARSALFAPVKDLGLIIVDEEHESSYKQGESPKYNARDVAVMRGLLERCTVVLGSATPSLESYNNALNGKYKLTKLQQRVDNRSMPAVRVVDMRLEMQKEGKIGAFSRDLIGAIGLRLNNAQQTIIFLNRRGFATSLICPKCGYVVQCKHCSIPMTYHKNTADLCCHICGTRRSVPNVCPNVECKDPAIRYVGLGTQRVEDILKKIFPQARIARMDADSVKGKDAHSKILGEFRIGKIDILIGTQMIAKGLHFPNVTLVGVVNADTALYMPDFRAAERTFQLLTQVAGRAGRGDIKGEVIIQTFTPFHAAIQAARRLDFESFADQEMEFRKELNYPPFYRLACVTFRGEIDDSVRESAEKFANILKDIINNESMEGCAYADVAPAPIAKVKNCFRYQIMIRAASAAKINKLLKIAGGEFQKKGVLYSIDIDAINIM